MPTVLAAALASPGGRCYRHCDRPIRTRRLRTRLPGVWSIRACPTGVVSLTSYAERTSRDPTPDVLAVLRRLSSPPRLVRAWDLRLATRRGPELGRRAERWLASTRPPRTIRVVYWRLYPFRARDGTERRLFVCQRRRHREPVFFVANPSKERWGCPVCARRSPTLPKGR